MVSTIPPGAPRLLSVVALGIALVFALAHGLGLVVPARALFSTVLIVFVLGDLAVHALTGAVPRVGFLAMVLVNAWCMAVWTHVDDVRLAPALLVAGVIAVGAAVVGRMVRQTIALPAQLQPIAAILMAVSWLSIGKGALGLVIGLGFCVYDTVIIVTLAAGIDDDTSDDEAWARATRLTDVACELGWNAIVVAARL